MRASTNRGARAARRARISTPIAPLAALRELVATSTLYSSTIRVVDECALHPPLLQPDRGRSGSRDGLPPQRGQPRRAADGRGRAGTAQGLHDHRHGPNRARRHGQLHYATQLAAGHAPFLWYPTRNTDITDDDVVGMVRSFIEARLRVRLTCYQAELQTWPVGIESEPHIHKKGREIGDYNSLLYLNDDFTGGEFYAEPGIRVRPVRNRLTFFDGSKNYHGITKVGGRHRYTMILWWRDTESY